MNEPEMDDPVLRCLCELALFHRENLDRGGFLQNRVRITRNDWRIQMRSRGLRPNRGETFNEMVDRYAAAGVIREQRPYVELV